MSIIQGSAMQGASRGFYPKELTGSLRFNDDDSAYLSWTPTSAGNRKTWTFSAWVKRGAITGGNQDLFAPNIADQTQIWILSGGAIRFYQQNTSVDLQTTPVFRDHSAWYHFVFEVDTTQATASNRIKIYVNGEQITAFDTANYPSQNTDMTWNTTNEHRIGGASLSYLDGYLAEVFFIDGTAHDADDFGETKNGVWVPKNITATDFTMGTNGFHLTFEDDTEVEAFNTVLYRGQKPTVNSVTGVGFRPSMVWIKERDNTRSHRIYDEVRGAFLEVVPDSTAAEAYSENGLRSFDSDGFTVGNDTSTNANGSDYVAWCWDAGANNASTGHSSVTYSGNQTDGTRISGLPFTPDLVWLKERDSTSGHQLYDSVRGADYGLRSESTAAEFSLGEFGGFDKNGFIVNNSNGINQSGQTYVAWAWDAGDSDPVSNTDGSITSTVKASQANGFSIVTFTSNGSSGQTIGHGLGVAPKMVIAKNRSSTGNWWVYHYDIGNANYMELNTTIASTGGANVWSSTHPSSTVVYSGLNSLVPTSGHEVVMYCFADVTGKQKFGTYTGNGSADGPEVTLGFRPGFVMLKRTNDTSNWRIYDSSRNPLNDVSHDLYPDTSDSEGTTDAIRFTDDGFKLVFAGGTGLNASGSTYIYAAFAGSYSDYITDYNTDGSIDSRVKASDTTGFSIVSYVGTGANATVGHGLSAAPDMIIVKRREAASAWEVQHSALGAVANQDISLNETTGAASGGVERWHQLPTSSVFSVGTGSNTNASGEGMIAYCWTATTGVSSFGSYTGTGSNQTINFGFRPAFFLTKSTSAGDPWVILDATRETVNDRNFVLQPNSSAVEDTDNDDVVEFTDTGVVIKSTSGWSNRSGIDYIYAAFADTREAAFWLDQSSNDNDWQPNNLDHNDTVSDSPTDNFATMSPITVAEGQAQATLSEGNLKVDLGTPGTSVAHTYGTMAIPSSGQYYFEATFSDVSGGPRIGISVVRTTGNQSRYVYISSGQKIVGTSASSYGDSYAAGDTIGVAVDVDASTIEFYKNGTGQGSFSIDLTASTGGSASDYFPFITNGSGTSKSVVEFNFGQQPFKYSPPE